MAIRMRKIVTLILLVSIQVFGSNPPLSGSFSNVTSEETYGYTPNLKLQMNLLVSANKSGQQFFVQCFSSGEAGLGVATNFNQSQIKVKVEAGEYCPSKSAVVELDYEGAIVRFQNGWVYLPRGAVYVPTI